ncbi:hypothetical protein EDB85DRAFT_2001529 [Lactarius pseudohatsudake]|nr:hypothetical protein EDB85DRAFT_2045579 [Lactarius pseudohatsudake]KAH9021050.1 hypothetical protein EDB85DRAFT_2001529 [Lactarius pseudohatsudake]
MSSDERLAPGFRHVDAFGSDSLYECNEHGEIIEEVSYVTLDLGAVEPTLVPSTSTYRLIGLDTPTPFLQLSGTIFQGTHQSLLGTELLFTEDKDIHERAGRKITHLANTSQRIRFKQVEVRPKGAPPEPSDLPTRRKGKRAPKTQKVDGRDANVVDLITGNVDPSSTVSQGRNVGKGNGSGGSESQTSQSERVAVSEETPSAQETAMDS